MKLSLGKKMAGGFGLAVAALVLVCVLAYWGTGKILNTSTDVMKSRDLDRILTQSELDHLVWGRKVVNAVVDPEAKTIEVQTDPHQCNFGKWYYGEGRKEAEKRAPYLSKPLTDMEAPHNQLHQSAEKIKALLVNGDREGATTFYLQTTRPIIRQLVATFDSMRDDVKKNVLSDEMLVNLTRSNQRTIGILGVVFSLALIAIAWILPRNIVSMLKKIILGLTDAAEQTASSAVQVSSASQSLAEGASQQAAGLEETSSSIEELTSMTKQNADNATQANTLMNDTGKVVDEANQAMKDLTQSMQEISSASEETGKIIKTIDEIAFQTNLLALNAAVEAARAGEAGAGFAVVADEVRNLAMRAAEAAKNTANLIEGTVKKIKNGSDIVTRTDEAFQKVAGGSKKVAGLVGEIAAASQEQAQGIDKINKTVSEMDNVVQQNAASAEESASASEEMNAQAEQLKGYVNELTLVINGNGNGNGNGFRQTQVLTSGEGNGKGMLKIDLQAKMNLKKGLPKLAVTDRRIKPGAGLVREVRSEQVIPMEEEEFKEF